MKRILQIDGLRAVASLLVVSFHYINNQLVNSQNSVGKFFAKLFSFGWAGVDLFFVLSGFLIGSILINNKTKNNYFVTFYVRRLLRIIPNYYLFLFLFLLLGCIPLFKEDYFIAGNNVIPIWSYFIMLQNVFMGLLKNMGNGAMSVTWSIGIEEQFYIIIPFIIYFFNKRLLPYLLVIFIVVANLFRWYYTNPNISFNIPAYVLLPCRMDAISIGIIIAIIHSNIGLEVFIAKYKNKIIFSFVATIMVCIFLFIANEDLGIIKNTLFALFFGCLLMFAIGLPNSFYAKILSYNWLVWIGKISYSLYLFHYLILGVVKTVAFTFICNETSQTLFVISILALSFSILFSWLVYKYLETPCVFFGKKFKYN